MGAVVEKIAKMILSLVFFCFCGIVTCSPVSEVEDRGLVGDIAMGILVGKIQEMLGITTTPKPRPVLDGIAGLFGATTTTAAPPTDEEKLGLLQTLFSPFFPAADTTTTTTTPTTTKCGGLLGGGLLGCSSNDETTTTTTTAAPATTTTKCGGLLGGGLLADNTTFTLGQNLFG